MENRFKVNLPKVRVRVETLTRVRVVSAVSLQFRKGSAKLGVSPGRLVGGKSDFLSHNRNHGTCMPGLIAQFSKCDFWNLGEIWDRNRYSKKLWSKQFSSKKIRNCWSKFCLDQKLPFLFLKKCSLKKLMKIQNFEISKMFRKCLKF